METLADLCSQPHSFGAFDRILHHLLREKDKGLVREGIAYAEQALASWEDQHRRASIRWIWPRYTKQKPHPALSLVRWLVWDQAMRPSTAAQVAASPHLSHLSGLTLYQSLYGEDVTTAILASPSLDRLTRLTLYNNPANYPEAHIEGLLSSPHLPRLTHLSFEQGAALTFDQIDQLSESNLASLIALKFYGWRTERADWAILFTWDNGFRTLEQLTLDSVRLAEENASTLIKGAALPQLRQLSLAYNHIREAGAKAFAEGCALPPLASLSLPGCYIGPKGAADLAQSPCIRELTHLDLSACDIGDEGLKALAQSPHLGQLEQLKLQGNQLGSNGLEALAAAPNFRSLRTLDLSYNPIGDDGMIALVNSPHLTGLTGLSIHHNDSIGPRGWEALAPSPMAAFFEVHQFHQLPFHQTNLEQARHLGMAPHMPPERRQGYLRGLSKAELQEIAATYQLKGRSKMKKVALIEALSRHTAPPPAIQREEEPGEQDHALFPRLRKLLTYTPSTGAFAQIMWLFSQWEEDESRTLALAYAEEHLASWDDELRASEELTTYWPDFPDGPAHPAFRLIRRMEIDRDELREALRRQPLDSYPHASALQTITSIRLTDRHHHHPPVAWHLLASSSQLTNLTSLELRADYLDERQIPEAVGNAPLQELRLQHNQVTVEAIDALAQWGRAGIERLSISTRETLGTDLHLPLFTSSFLRDAKDVSLNGVMFTAEGMDTFRDCEPLGSLETLDLSGTHEQGIHHLLVGPFATALTSLTLRLDEHADETLKALADSPHLETLRHLSLHFGSPSSEGMAALARAPFAPHLESLILNVREFDDAAVEALLEPSTLTSLRVLHFPRTHTLTASSMKRLANSPSMAKLEVLAMPRDQGTESFAHLAASPYLTSLRRLDCRSTQAEAMEPLLRSPLAQQIVLLDLRSCSPCDKVAELLAQRPFDQLEVLMLGERLTEEGVKRLSQCQFGSLRVLLSKGTLVDDRVAFDALSRASYLAHLTDLFFERVGALSLMNNLSLEAAEAFAACVRSEPFSTFPSTNDQHLDPEVATIMGMSTHLQPQVRRTYLQSLTKKRLQQLARQAGYKGLSKMDKGSMLELLSHHDG